MSVKSLAFAGFFFVPTLLGETLIFRPALPLMALDTPTTPKQATATAVTSRATFRISPPGWWTLGWVANHNLARMQKERGNWSQFLDRSSRTTLRSTPLSSIGCGG